MVVHAIHVIQLRQEQNEGQSDGLARRKWRTKGNFRNLAEVFTAGNPFGNLGIFPPAARPVERFGEV
jgi:hypothetical protein